MLPSELFDTTSMPPTFAPTMPPTSAAFGHHGRIADETRGDATCVVARVAAASSAPGIRLILSDLPAPTIADMNRTHTTVRPMSTDDTIAPCSAATATQPHRARRCRKHITHLSQRRGRDVTAGRPTSPQHCNA
jgi:hypothetical protein